MITLGELKNAIAVSDALERLPDDTPVILETGTPTASVRWTVESMRSDEIHGTWSDDPEDERYRWCFVLSAQEDDGDNS